MNRPKRKNISHVSFVEVLQSIDDPIEANECNNDVKKIDFAYSFRPIYCYSRLFGLMPFSLICDSNGEIERPAVNKLDFVWFTLSISIYLLIAIMSVQHVTFLQNAHAYVLTLGHFVFLIVGLIFDIIMIVMSMLKRFKLVDIVKKFVLVDKAVSYLKIFSNYVR